MQSMKAALLLPTFCGLSVTTVSPAKADELIEMLFGGEWPETSET